jgi:hypothetical protein
VVGLVTTIILMALAFPHALVSFRDGNRVHGSGLLHILWWWQQRTDHQDLSDLEHPSEFNLRVAGSVTPFGVETTNLLYPSTRLNTSSNKINCSENTFFN